MRRNGKAGDRDFSVAFSHGLGVAALISGLYILGQRDFLFFHTGIELFAVSVGWGVFLIAWSSRRMIDNHYIVLLGISFFFTGILDIVHTLTYKGMGVVTGYGSGIATQLWIAARYLQAVSMLVASIYVRRRMTSAIAFPVYAVITLLLLASIFIWRIFPECFLDGTGLTPFKIASEYVIILLFALSGITLYLNRSHFEKTVLRFLAVFTMTTIISEFCFTRYTNLYGMGNIFGHLFKLTAYYFCYRAIVEGAVTNPTGVLFWQLKQTEEALLSAQGELKERLRERTTELNGTSKQLSTEVEGRKRVEGEKEILQAQFLQSQKMEAVGRLAGGIAHDFNNMMTAVIGFSEMLLDKVGNDHPIRKGLEQIKRAGENAASLTGQLLAFSRKQVLQPRIISINTQIEGMKHMLKRLIGEDVDLETVLSVDTANVNVDPVQFQQVLINLVVNARDAIPNGGKVTVESHNIFLDDDYAHTHEGVKSGNYVLLEVSDTGIGMDEETKSKIFEPFYTTKELGKGTGLGLATVYGIVKQSGGHIWVYSEPGKGTTFKLYFPSAEGAVAHPTLEDIAPKALRGKETILVVEDEDIVREVIKQALEINGYHALVAKSAKEAEEIFRQNEGNINLMITDVVMPGTSGPDLASRIQASRKTVRVLFISGYSDEAIVRHGILGSGTAFLPKPFSPNQLARKVREILDS